MKRIWHHIALWIAGAAVLAVLVVLDLPPGRSDIGISRFVFANRSDRVVSNLDLHFVQIVPDGGARFDEYAQSFSHHFTNVFPGYSIVVTSSTPVLMLTSLQVSHSPRIILVGTNVIDEWYFSWYQDPVIVATPDRSAGLSFTFPREFARIGER